jgi:hypothetical protein
LPVLFLPVVFWLSVPAVLLWLPDSGCLVLAVCSCCLFLTAFFWLSSGYPDLAIFLLSCFGYQVLAVLHVLSVQPAFPYCHFMAVLLLRFCSYTPVTATLPIVAFLFYLIVVFGALIIIPPNIRA